MIFEWVGRDDFLLVLAYLHGAEASDLTAYSDQYRGDASVPDLPPFLDIVSPGGTAAQQRAAFFTFFDNHLNERLAQHDDYKNMTEEQWIEVKLGKRYPDLRPIAAEEQAVAHPLLLAFFNRRVKLYIDRLQPLIDSGAFKRAVRVAVGQGEMVTIQEDPPALSADVQKRIVQQLIRDFRAGMIRAENMKQQQIDQQVVDAALPNALALGQAGDAIWGEGESRLIAQMAYALAVQSGDPLVDDDAIAKALKPLLTQESAAQVTIDGELPKQIQPGEPFELSCRIAATPDFERPFRVRWSFAGQGGGGTGQIQPLAASSGSNLMLAHLPVTGGGKEIVPGKYVIRAEVTDATGREVNTAERTLTIEGDGEPRMVGGDGAKAMMYVRLESKPVDHGEAAGFMRYASTVEFEWQMPDAKNANFTTHHQPHVWVDWPQRPDGHNYYFLGRITGGYPPIETELSLSFRTSARMFSVLSEKDGLFIFPLPDFEAREHVGTYRITGRVLAITAEELAKHGQREWHKATPAAERAINIELTYHPVAPLVKRSQAQLMANGVARGSAGFDLIEPGKRIATINFAGATRYQLMSSAISVEVPYQTSVPTSATVSFMNFGEVMTLPIAFEDVRDMPTMFEPNYKAIEGTLQRIADYDKPNNRTRLTDLREEYRRLAHYYISNDVAVDFDAWHNPMERTFALDAQIVELIANPQWDEYEANADFRRREFEGESFRNLDGGKKMQAAREFQQDYCSRLVYEYTDSARTAAKSGRMDVAGDYLAQAEAMAAKIGDHEQHASYAWGQIASAYSVLSGEVLKLTGSLEQAHAWFDHSEVARKVEARVRGREYHPRQFDIHVDEKFGYKPPPSP
jgi:hypothetical protein